MHQLYNPWGHKIALSNPAKTFFDNEGNQTNDPPKILGHPGTLQFAQDCSSQLLLETGKEHCIGGKHLAEDHLDQLIFLES